MNIDSLFISLGLDTKNVERDLQQVGNKLETGFRGIAARVVAPLVAAFATGQLVTTYLSQADAIGKLSESMNENIEEMQAWGEAAERSGGSVQGFYQSLGSMNEKVQEFAKFGEGEGKKIFGALGISVKDAGGNVKGTTDLLLELSGAAEKMDKAQFVGFAKKLGIDQGTIMLLQSGSKSVEELIKRQKELGVYTAEDAKIAAQANDAIADFRQVLQHTASIVLRHVVPVLTVLSESLTDIFVYIRKHQPFVLAVFGSIATIVTAKLIPAMTRLAIANAKAVLPLIPLIVAIGAVALAIDDLVTYMKGGKSYFEGFWSSFGSPDELKAKFESFKNTLKSVVAAIVEWKKPILVAIGAFAGLYTAVKTVMAVKTAILALKGAFDVLKLAVAANPLLFWVTVIATAAMLIIQNWDTLKGWFSSFFDWMSEKLKWWTDKLQVVKDFFGGGSKSFSASVDASVSKDAAQSVSPTVGRVGESRTDIKNSNSFTVQKLEVTTQSTDANGMAAAASGALKGQFEKNLVAAANTGVR